MGSTVCVQIRDAAYYRQLSRAVTRFAGSGFKYVRTPTEANEISEDLLSPVSASSCPDIFDSTIVVASELSTGEKKEEKTDE